MGRTSLAKPAHVKFSKSFRTMADRQQLAQAAKDLIVWINTKEVNPSTLTNICSADVVVPIPYPGSTPDLDGLVGVTTKIHGASPDWSMTLQKMVIDQTE